MTYSTCTMILETTEVRYDITVKLQCVKQLIMKVQYIKLYFRTTYITYRRREKISNLTVTSPRPCNLQAEIFHRFCVQDDFSGEERFKQVFRPRRVYFERLVNESTAWSNAEKIWKFRRLLDSDLVSTGLPTG